MVGFLIFRPPRQSGNENNDLSLVEHSCPNRAGINELEITVSKSDSIINIDNQESHVVRKSFRSGVI